MSCESGLCRKRHCWPEAGCEERDCKRSTGIRNWLASCIVKVEIMWHKRLRVAYEQLGSKAESYSHRSVTLLIL